MSVPLPVAPEIAAVPANKQHAGYMPRWHAGDATHGTFALVQVGSHSDLYLPLATALVAGAQSAADKAKQDAQAVITSVATPLTLAAGVLDIQQASATLEGSQSAAGFKAASHLRETNSGNEINIDADANASIVGGGAQTILLANAKYDGTNFNRLNTGAGAARVILGLATLTLDTAAAGANPITWAASETISIADLTKLHALSDIRSLASYFTLAANQLTAPLLSTATSATTGNTLMLRAASGFPDGGAWQAPTLSANWSNFGGGWANAAYRWDATGRVNLRGMIKKSIAVVGGETLFTLFAGFRPPADEYFPVVSNGALGTITVSAAGAVSLQIGNAAYVSLSGISFDTA